MCGIVGIVGLADAPRLVREGLTRLEYRGYDSAGIAWSEAGAPLSVERRVGRVAGLPPIEKPACTLAIGHTRWATHGGVTQANAHPHLDGTGRFAVVHNGTLEEHASLRSDLEEKGHVFQSETDSEVLSHLYERERRAHPPLEALRKATHGLKGSWSFLMMDADARGIVFVRQRTPLLLGIAEGATLFASDLTALLPHTRKVIFLEDGDHGVADATGLRLFDAKGRPRTLQPETIDWDIVQAELGGFQHYMLKEIHETGPVLNQCIGDRIRRRPLSVDLGIGQEVWDDVRSVRLVACGTSYHAARLGAWMMESWAGIPSQAIVASELRDRPPLEEPRALTIGVSQSGETLDTLEALRVVVARGDPVLAVCNVQGSSLQRLADATVMIRVGPEVGVAATKTFAGQVTTLALLALERGLATRRLDAVRAQTLGEAIRFLPRTVNAILAQEDALAVLGRRLSQARSLFFLGHGAHVGTAMEAALKFKEITYSHAEGIGSAELKHGPFALLDETTPCIFFLAKDAAYNRVLGNIQEVRARGAPVHVVTQGPIEDLEGLVDTFFQVPATDPLLAAIPFAIVGQLLAYHAAAALGRDIDKPRNLAKSITVE